MSENEGEVLSYAVELWKQQDVFAFIKLKFDCLQGPQCLNDRQCLNIVLALIINTGSLKLDKHLEDYTASNILGILNK